MSELPKAGTTEYYQDQEILRVAYRIIELLTPDPEPKDYRYWDITVEAIEPDGQPWTWHYSASGDTAEEAVANLTKQLKHDPGWRINNMWASRQCDTKHFDYMHFRQTPQYEVTDAPAVRP